jgi:putative ABC transport system permease protein
VEGLDEMPRMRTAFVDEDYAETFDIPLAAGRDFSQEHPSDGSHAIMINEAGAREIGWSPEEAIGKHLQIRMIDTIDREVIGVYRDFHFASLKAPIEPMVLSPVTSWVSQIAVRVHGNDYQSIIAGIEEAWKTLAPQYPFTFQFLDDRLNRLYKNEQLQSRLFEIFAAISILIACLGIVGLATFTAGQRNREIGIRKVLGASVGQLTYMVMREFLFLVLAASILACPLGWWSTEVWLSEFAYRINVDPVLFLMVPLITLGIAVLSVIYQALRVATNNPATVLKEE